MSGIPCNFEKDWKMHYDVLHAFHWPSMFFLVHLLFLVRFALNINKSEHILLKKRRAVESLGPGTMKKEQRRMMRVRRVSLDDVSFPKFFLGVRA